MRKFAKLDDEAEINMTPMLDIVFIMLIFFIVTAAFVKEAGIQVNRPEATNTFMKPRTSILIAVTESDQVWINRRRVEIKALRTTIEKLHSENPRGTIVIQADVRAKAGLTLEVMDAIKQAGIPEISVAAVKR